jgi:hypothetical protein
MIALVDQCPDGMHSHYYSIDDIRKLLPDRSAADIEDAVHDEEARNYLESLPVISGDLRVRLTDRAYEDFDPVAKGWFPAQDAIVIARSMLQNEEQAASKIQIAVGMERRRFNPAFQHLLQYLEANGVGGFISREIQPDFPAAAVVFTPKVKGVLRKLISDSPSQLSPSQMTTPYELPGILPVALITQRISQRAGDVEFVAGKLAALIDRELEELDQNKPNEPEGLLAHEEYRTFLQEVRDGLNGIAAAVNVAREEPSPTAKRAHFAKASEIVRTLGDKFDEWIKKNSTLAVDYSSKTVLLGLGTLFLTTCGAPAYMAFPVLTYLLGGKRLHDAVKGAMGKGKKADKEK